MNARTKLDGGNLVTRGQRVVRRKATRVQRRDTAVAPMSREKMLGCERAKRRVEEIQEPDKCSQLEECANARLRPWFRSQRLGVLARLEVFDFVAIHR